MYQQDDIGIYCGEDLVVFDCDTEESNARLQRIEKEFGLSSNLITQTRRGFHHYYRKPSGVKTRNYSCNTELDPAGIDIKCGHQYIIAPPSDGKIMLSAYLPPLTQLTELTQIFFDTVMLANGVQPPRQIDQGNEAGGFKPLGDTITRLSVFLRNLDPDEGGYDAWIRTLMAIFNATKGSEDGLALAIDWSSRGEKFRGPRDVETRWYKFRSGERVITEATIISQLTKKGLDPIELLSNELDPEFERIEAGHPKDKVSGSYFSRFSAVPHLEQLRRLKRDVQPILGPLAVEGELTIISAGPNSGKTLITLYLLLKEITESNLDPKRLVYINCDDSLNAFIEKTEIAAQHGFDMVGPSSILGTELSTFSPSDIVKYFRACIDDGSVRGTIVVLDTLKKFVDPIQKHEAREFMIACTDFCAAGGSLIGLGHTNKSTNPAKETTYEGTGDFYNDAHRMWQCSCTDKPDGTRVTTFHMIKSRVPGDRYVEIQFDHSNQNSFHERLNSVKILSCGNQLEIMDSDDLLDLEAVPKVSETMIVNAILDQLQEGSLNQTTIVSAVREALKISKSKVQEVLNRHAGEDPSFALWTVSKGLRNASIYSLLNE
jgi:hypothetical protein